MSGLRGDDELHSLLNEMGGGEGAGEGWDEGEGEGEGRNQPPADAGGPSPGPGPGPDERGGGARLRQDEGASSSVLWNSAVRAGGPLAEAAEAGAGGCGFVPTNPEVELLRRRSYERFKKAFQTAFRSDAERAQSAESDARLHAAKRGGGRAGAAAAAAAALRERAGTNRTWSELPSHAILERWHFATKLAESLGEAEGKAQTQTQTQTQTQPREGAGPPGRPSTAEVRRGLLGGRSDRQRKSVDPILVSASGGGSGEKRKGKGRPDATLLLRQEVQFQWRRERKRKMGGKASPDSIDEELRATFASKGFGKRVSRISRDVMEAAREAEAEFFRELGKRAAQQQQQQQPAASKKRRKKDKSVPRISFAEDAGGNANANTNTNADRREVTVAYSGLSLRINEAHFAKLQTLFDRFGPQSATLSEHRDAFASAIFSLLARYDSLEGGGLQSSLTGNVFDVLYRRFGCCAEMFASPFNSRYERFCSAFPDTDCAFGSMGSFFGFDPASCGGCFQANPPFIAGFIDQMYQRIHRQLITCRKALMFVVFIPAWSETQGWRALSGSAHLSKHVLLGQKTDPHFYCEGTQHRRTGRYRIASFDTSVFFLQNAAARTKWPVTDDIVEELKAAFRRNPDAEDPAPISNTEKVAFEARNLPIRSKADREDIIPASKKTLLKHRESKPLRRSGMGEKVTPKKKKRKTLADESMQSHILASLGILDEVSRPEDASSGKKGKGGKKMKQKQKHKK